MKCVLCANQDQFAKVVDRFFPGEKIIDQRYFPVVVYWEGEFKWTPWRLRDKKVEVVTFSELEL